MKILRQKWQMLEEPMNPWRRLFALVAAMVCLAVICQAQDAPEVLRVRARPEGGGKWQIRVLFSQTFGDEAGVKSAETKGNYALIDTQKQSFLPITATEVLPISSSLRPTLISDPTHKKGSNVVLLVVNQELSGGDKGRYLLSLVGVKFSGKEIERTTQALTFVAPPTAQSTTATTATPRDRVLSKANDRDEADVFFSGEVSRASGTAFTGTIDLKLGYPQYLDFWKRSHIVTPLFQLKASSDPKADADSLKLGGEWKVPLRDTLYLKNSLLIESQRNFRNTNFIAGSRFMLLPRVATFGQLNFKPFLGAEVGKNLVSPVSAAEGKALARVLTGAYLNLNFKLGLPAIKAIGFEGTYERRILLRREVGFKTVEEEGKEPRLVLVEYGKRPRQWAEAKLKFRFSELVGTYVGYEYGELPPAYKLVNHQLKVGLTFSGTYSTNK